MVKYSFSILYQQLVQLYNAHVEAVLQGHWVLPHLITPCPPAGDIQVEEFNFFSMPCLFFVCLVLLLLLVWALREFRATRASREASSSMCTHFSTALERVCRAG